MFKKDFTKKGSDKKAERIIEQAMVWRMKGKYEIIKGLTKLWVSDWQTEWVRKWLLERLSPLKTVLKIMRFSICLCRFLGSHHVRSKGQYPHKPQIWKKICNIFIFQNDIAYLWEIDMCKNNNKFRLLINFALL